MKPTIIIPFRDEPGRAESLDVVLAWWKNNFPGWRVIVEQDDDAEFCKGRLINAGAAKSKAETLIISDADVIPLVVNIKEGVNCPWCLPFDEVLRLDTEYRTLRHRKGTRHAGGVWIIRRDIFDLVGGVDERYVQWGGEDESFCRAVQTLYGSALMLPGPLLHLWHPPAPESDRFKKTGNYKLYRQYCHATGHPERMKALCLK